MKNSWPALQVDLAEQLVKGRERLYLAWFFDHLTTNKDAFTAADIDEYARSMSAAGALRAGFSYYAAFAQDIEANKAFASAKLAVPILGVGGANYTGSAVAALTSTLASNVDEVDLDRVHAVHATRRAGARPPRRSRGTA